MCFVLPSEFLCFIASGAERVLQVTVCPPLSGTHNHFMTGSVNSAYKTSWWFYKFHVTELQYGERFTVYI